MCEIKGCYKKIKARGLCSMHLSRLNRHGNVNYEHPMKHSKEQNPEYFVYRTMINRCYNKTQDSYKYYGGRGIVVCERWLNNFQNFYLDMGERPSNKHQIDRINNSDNYEPDNCQWVTAAENARNRSTTILNLFTVKSIRRLYAMNKYTQIQLSKIYNVSIYVIFDVVHYKTWKEAV